MRSFPSVLLGATLLLASFSLAPPAAATISCPQSATVVVVGLSGPFCQIFRDCFSGPAQGCSVRVRISAQGDGVVEAFVDGASVCLGVLSCSATVFVFIPQGVGRDINCSASGFTTGALVTVSCS